MHTSMILPVSLLAHAAHGQNLCTTCKSRRTCSNNPTSGLDISGGGQELQPLAEAMRRPYHPSFQVEACALEVYHTKGFLQASLYTWTSKQLTTSAPPEPILAHTENTWLAAVSARRQGGGTCSGQGTALCVDTGSGSLSANAPQSWGAEVRIKCALDSAGSGEATSQRLQKCEGIAFKLRCRTNGELPSACGVNRESDFGVRAAETQARSANSSWFQENLALVIGLSIGLLVCCLLAGVLIAKSRNQSAGAGDRGYDRPSQGRSFYQEDDGGAYYEEDDYEDDGYGDYAEDDEYY